jgi:hypothetical protein
MKKLISIINDWWPMVALVALIVVAILYVNSIT